MKSDGLLPNFADMKDPEDSLGRSYREANREKKHSIPIGTLVELSDGVRLWVVAHTRDCDQTPLYELSHDRDDIVEKRPGFRNNSWTGGWSKESITVIKWPEEV